MARIRTIKPEFWKHEGLCTLPESTHMFAAALLNYADDFGYFNANPGLIKGEIYPLREPSVSIPESLRSLQAAGYIRLGTADGRRYGHVVAFEDHQRVSHPTASKISVLSITWDVSGISPEPFVKAPDVFVPEQGTGNREVEQGRERDLSPVGDEHPKPVLVTTSQQEPLIPDFLLSEQPTKSTTTAVVPVTFDPLERAKDAYNAVAKFANWPACSSLNATRRKALTARMAECGGLAGWVDAMAKASSSGYLLGTKPRSPGWESWSPDFDFFLQRKSFTKLMEGSYDDRDVAPTAGSGSSLGRIAEAAAIALAGGDHQH